MAEYNIKQFKDLQQAQSVSINNQLLVLTNSANNTTKRVNIGDLPYITSAGGTMTGSLAISKASDSRFLAAQRSDITKGTSPASSAYWSFAFCDRVGTSSAYRLGSIEGRYTNAGEVRTDLMAYQPVNASTSNTRISVGYDANGNTYTYAPTPSSATDNSTKIATTAWVANHRCTSQATTVSSASINAPCYVVENYYNSSTGDWYRIFSDGWIEQGGTLSGSASSIVVSLLKTMSNTDYFVSVQQRYNDNDTGGYGDSPCEITGASPYDYGLKEDSFRCSIAGNSSKYTWMVCGY